MRFFRLLLASGVLVGLAGCAQPVPTPTLLPPSPVPSVTPAPPTPTLMPRDPTPRPSFGIVVGTLLLNGQPAAENTLYLVKVIKPEGDNTLGVAALDPVNDPRVDSDGLGYFLFLDVEPARYGLGIMSPGGPVLIRGDDGREIIVTVEAGETVALGDVHIVPFGQ